MVEYDYIVIGSGSAGGIVASRLSEDPNATVLLLEAGGSDRTPLVRKPGMVGVVHQVKQLKRRFDWGFATVPQRHMNDRCVPYTRGKVIGGSSSINGMLYLRGHRENYDGWAASGCEGWSYEDVLPFFKKLESHEDGETAYHGASGPIRVTRHPADQISPVSNAFLEAASQVCGIPIGNDFNAENQNCASMFQMSASDGVRSAIGDCYVQPALERPNFHVEMRALVHRIVIENGRATGVEYQQPDGTHIARANREVIVSGGAIGSPQVLMLSGIGPADHLRTHGIDVRLDLPGVGKNLHDHLFVPITYRSPTSLHRGTALHFLGGMMHEYLFGGGWFGRTSFEAGAFIKSFDGAHIPDVQLHTMPWGYFTPNQDGPGKPDLDTGHCLSILVTLIYPKSRGELLLTSDRPDQKPHIDPAFLKEPEDMQLLIRAIRKSREICAHPIMAEHLREELSPGAQSASEEELIEEIKLRGCTGYHPVGTCKMGVDDMAVVDPKLRVRGLDGLRVADASIMPTVPGGNTNAPSMMIGERAAALIAEGSG
jgi:choline dehydrogenase-like flavoprotein